MTLQKREKLLAIATAVLVLWLLVRFLLGGTWPSVSARRAERDRLAAEVQKKQNRIQASLPAAAQMAEWQHRALPADVKLAGTLYQNWLTKLAGSVELQKIRVEPGESRPVRNIYHLFSFTLRGQGSFDSLVRFLFEFYLAGHLHQIRHLTMKPLEDPKRLDLVIIVEAISMPGADRVDKLCDEAGKRLALGKLEEYQRPIVERQLFAPYRPPVQAPPPEVKRSEPVKPPFDATKFVYLTAVVEANGRMQAWLISRTTDKMFRLGEGDALDIDTLHGKVVRIGRREVEIEVDGQKGVIHLGTSLREGLPAPKSPEKPSEQPADKPEAKPIDKPADKPGDKPSEKPDDKPGEKPAEKPAQH